jgi:hypothetical protein
VLLQYTSRAAMLYKQQLEKESAKMAAERWVYSEALRQQHQNARHNQQQP